MLLWCGLLEFMHGIGDQSDSMGETDPITIQADLLRGSQHEGAHRIVAQQEAVPRDTQRVSQKGEKTLKN